MPLNQRFKIIQFKKKKKILSFLVELDIECKPSTPEINVFRLQRSITNFFLPFILRVKNGAAYFKDILNHVCFRIKKEKIAFSCFASV